MPNSHETASPPSSLNRGAEPSAGQERLADQVRDVVGVGAPRDRVPEHPGLMTAVKTAERLGIPPGRGRQQLRVGLLHTYYLPAPGPAFQMARLIALGD
jgi:hypothetical protein